MFSYPPYIGKDVVKCILLVHIIIFILTNKPPFRRLKVDRIGGIKEERYKNIQLGYLNRYGGLWGHIDGRI